MDRIVIMLKKFKGLNQFFHLAQNKVNLTFSPFVVTIDKQVLQVMQASDDDIPNLLMLEQKVYSGYMPWDELSFRTELNKRKNTLYLVVYHVSTLIAFIGVRFRSREAHITNIAVAPEFQHQHVGTFLMQLMIERARQNGSECVSLEVRVDNELAQKFYQLLGFEATFIRKNYYQDIATDALNMVLWLKPHQVNKRKKLKF